MDSDSALNGLERRRPNALLTPDEKAGQRRARALRLSRIDDPGRMHAGVAIRLEGTGETGLRHLDGTISMARAGPDTGRAEFFICIGAQPELDEGGRRNADGFGFAAFGRVAAGMDVVRAIQAGATDGQRLVQPIRILRMVRVEP